MVVVKSESKSREKGMRNEEMGWRLMEGAD